MSIPVEIERKYVIEMPDTEMLKGLGGYSVSEIDQTYLSSSPAVTHRVRSRRYPDRTVYTETKKMRIDSMSSFEDEKEIERDEYERLLLQIAPDTSTIRKVRHTFIYSGRVFEIDVYPNWSRSCVLEVELESRESSIDMPPFIRIISDVTGDKKYSNASMARSFPEELI